MLKTGVLQARWGPIRAKIAPASTSARNPFSATRPPNVIESPSIASRATRLVGLQPVGERLEAPFFDAHPEARLLRLVVGADREGGQDAAAVEVLHRLQRGDQALARQILARALGALGEEHRGEVAGQCGSVRLV